LVSSSTCEKQYRTNGAVYILKDFTIYHTAAPNRAKDKFTKDAKTYFV